MIFVQEKIGTSIFENSVIILPPQLKVEGDLTFKNCEVYFRGLMEVNGNLKIENTTFKSAGKKVRVKKRLYISNSSFNRLADQVMVLGKISLIGCDIPNMLTNMRVIKSSLQITASKIGLPLDRLSVAGRFRLFSSTLLNFPKSLKVKKEFNPNPSLSISNLSS